MTLAIASIVVASLAVVVMLESKTEESAVVAVILPHEDELYSHAMEIELAVSMAMEELNEWGGVGNVQLRLVFEEVEPDLETVTDTFEELEAEHNPLMYITMSCPLVEMLFPLAEANSVPLVGMASAIETSEDSEWVYRYFISVTSEVQSVVSLMQELNIQSLGILYILSPHGSCINESLSEEVTTAGWTAQSAGCLPGETDFSEEISSISANEAIFVVASCGTLVGMLEAVKQSGYSGRVMTTSCGSSPEMRGLLPIDPVMVSAPSLYRPENVYALGFAEEFEERYNISMTHHGAIAYDLVNLVHDLLEGQNVTRADLGHQLKNGFIFSGVMGTIRIHPGTHDFDIPVYPAMVSGGELSYL